MKRWVIPVCVFTLSGQGPQPDKEAALGAQMAVDVRNRTTRIDSPKLSAYLDGIAGRLAPQLPAAAFPYHFEVVADSLTGRTHEPMALPGGYLFVPASLILSAKSEDELAGMLAHSMAHCAKRHGIKLTGSVGGIEIPLIFIGSNQDEPPLPAGGLEGHRRNELEADRLAAQALAGAGYDPGALAVYIAREQPEDNDRSRKFSAYPVKEIRLSELAQITKDLPAGQQSPDDEFARIQDEVRRLAGQAQGHSSPDTPPTLRRTGE